MSLTLFYTPGACAMASHIALEEAGADYELIKIDLSKGEQKTPEYLAVNPKGVTPALKTDRGVVTENVAITAFVAQSYPEKNLAPVDDPYAFATMQSLNSYLGGSLHPALGKLLFSRPPLQGEAREEAVKLATSKLQMIEDKLFVGPWANGDSYTVTDGYLYVFERWAKQGGLLDQFPKLSEHMQRVQARPAVQAVLSQEGQQPV